MGFALFYSLTDLNHRASDSTCTGISLPVMFVVTGLNTKRRPRSGTARSSVTIRDPAVERLSLPLAVPHSHRRLRPVKRSASSLGQTTPRVSGLRMSGNHSDLDAGGGNEMCRHSPIKVQLGRVVPPRIRKFIPKPLILVERMKARQLQLDSSPRPVTSGSRGSLPSSKAGMTTPFSTHMTPATLRMPARGTLSSDSCSSNSVSFRVSSRNGVVFGSGFGMMPRPARPLSADTLGDSLPSTDTFVADSPCCDKKNSSKVPLLVTASDPINLRLEVESHLEKRCASDSGVPVLVEPMTIDSAHGSLRTMDAFVPAVTSTPFASSCAHANDMPSPTAFVTSTVYPPRLRGHRLSLSDGSRIVPPTSRTAYPFNARKDAYTVKLPNSGPGVPKPALAFRRLSNRGASPSPTLVLDGVFALHRPSPPQLASSRKTLNGFHRTRKTSLRRSLAEMSNASAVASPFRPLTVTPTSSCVLSGPESPRSKLAHVLTAHPGPQTSSLERKQARVPPLVKGVEVSNDPRTRCEIEGLRMRRVVGGGVDSTTAGRGAIERMSLASVGMVARLRARWESGTAERWGGVDRRA